VTELVLDNFFRCLLVNSGYLAEIKVVWIQNSILCDVELCVIFLLKKRSKTNSDPQNVFTCIGVP